MGFLLDSFANTRLDLTEISPSEGFNNKDTITNYPSYVTLINQGRTARGINTGRFYQTWLPNTQYLTYIKPNTGFLRYLFGRTNFDTTNPGNYLGPIGFQFADISTNYPPTVTGTPSTESSTEFAKRFDQKYVGDAEGYPTYLEENPIKGEGKLKSTLANTNLDVSDERPEGGIPYERNKVDPTVYPVLAHRNSSTLGNFPIAGKPAQRFKHPFNPQKTYLDFMAPFIQTNRTEPSTTPTGESSRPTGGSRRPPITNSGGAGRPSPTNPNGILG